MLRLRTLRAWRDALGEDGQRSLAYTVDAAYNSPESELEAMRHGLGQALASIDTAAERLRRPDGSLSEPDAAWVHDYRTGNNAALALVANGMAFVTRQRMEPMHSFLDAAEAVLEGMCRYLCETSSALHLRVEWTSAICEALGAAAGCRLEAQATVPPLVMRMRLLDDDPLGSRLLALATTAPPPGEAPPRFVISRPDT
jgi:hypothetical protein